MPDYIRWIRSKVGHEKIILNYAGGCVIDHENRILLQKRAEENGWGFPGGAMELGESAEEAAIREIHEETGLTVKVERLLGVYTKYSDRYPNGDLAQPVTIMFLCSIAGGTLDPDNSETLELKFFTRNDLPHLYKPQHEDMLEDILSDRVGVFR